MNKLSPEPVFNQNIEIRKRKKDFWTTREKNKLFSILKRHGHYDVEKIVRVIPTKSESQIIRYFKKHRKEAFDKLKEKKDYNAIESLDTIHNWLPFVNMYCNVNPELHNNLIAFVLPFVEKYGNLSDVNKCCHVDFRVAYGALFNSLIELPFPNEMNNETLSMIYGSLHQLLNEIRTEQKDLAKTNEDLIRRCVNRCIKETTNNLEHNVQNKNERNIFHLPEINVLGLTQEESHLICKNNNVIFRN